MSIMSKLNVFFNELFGIRNVEMRRSSPSALLNLWTVGN